ncbi:MAG: TonB family protein [Rhizobiaceae bacterium]|nr:TonB family protein [Rhizobiaceae bacterium]
MSAATLGGGGLTPRETGLWTGAAAFVLAAHVLIGYGFQALRPFEMPPPAAEEALTIDLSPLTVTTPEAVESAALDGEVAQEVLEPLAEAAELPQAATVEQMQPIEEAEAQAVTPDEMAPVEPSRTVQPTQEVAQLVPTEAEPIREQQAEPLEPAEAPFETVQPMQAETVEPADRPEIVERLEAEPVEQVLPEVIAALPEPKPVVEEVPEPKPVKKAQAKPARKKPVEKRAAKAEAAEKTQEPKAAKAAKSESSVKSSASRAPTVSPARWQSRVIAWINRHKRYPSASKARGDQGQVQVNFAINASGVVVSASIGRSSGDAALDKAALDMVRRASPVPAPPPEIARSRIQLALPVQFSLR